jgi:hypothetical protein
MNSSRVTSDLIAYYQNSSQGNKDHASSNSQLAITDIAQTSFEEIAKPKTIRYKSFRRVVDNLPGSKLYFKYFKYDIDIHKQIQELMIDSSQNSLNQMKDLMRTTPLLREDKVKNHLKFLPFEDLLILQKLLKICQQEGSDDQNGERSPKFDMYFKEIESWSILFNRYENFESYLSEILKIRKDMGRVAFTV